MIILLRLVQARANLSKSNTAETDASPPVFSSLRVWAVWAGDWRPFLVVLLLGLVNPVLETVRWSAEKLLLY